MSQHEPLHGFDQQQAAQERTDTPAWAIAEYERNARQHAETLRRVAADAEWLRLWETRIACPVVSDFDRWYAARLDAGMARLEAMMSGVLP